MTKTFEKQRSSYGASGISCDIAAARQLLWLMAVLLLGTVNEALATDRPAETAASAIQEFRFHRDHVLGTSLDLVVVASDAGVAERCDAAVMAEIDRLLTIISTYHPDSEISRWTTGRGPTCCSAELLTVLMECEKWQHLSDGAFNARVGRLIEVWKQAEADGRLPETEVTAGIAAQIAKAGWRIDSDRRTATRLDDLPLNVDALAKGYVVDKALAAARAVEPGVAGMLLDIGGDLAVWGEPVGSHKDNDASSTARRWRVGVADPAHCQDNAPALTTLLLHGGAVATSGSYARGYSIGGQRYSHIFDARTGWPAQDTASATAVAADCMTADALATILCILPPEAGLRLVESLPDAECLIVGADGKQHASRGWSAMTAAPARKTGAATTANGPAVDISLTIKQPDAMRKKYSRPFVAVWLEDANGAHVRTLAVWGNEHKYLKELPQWWSFARNDNQLVATVTRASRGPGEYRLTWDGADDRGAAVPPGNYTVRVEAAREHGSHVDMRGAIDYGGPAAKTTIQGNSEIEGVLITVAGAAPRESPQVAKKEPPHRPAIDESAVKKPAEVFRTWTDATGKFSVEAAFGGFGAGIVTIKTRDGRSLKLALDKLSTEDQNWVRQRRSGGHSGE